MPDGSIVGDVTSLRLRLLANDYEPLPIIRPGEPEKNAGKRPRLPSWQSIEITPAVIRGWEQEFRADTNTGLRCGRIIGVDVDVLCADLSRSIEDLALALLGPTPLRRVGRAPKILLAYRAEGEQAKAETPEFILPDGTKAQVEVLARGQQFVSHGVHPGTGKAYVWTGQAPEHIAFADLPIAASSRVRAFLAAAESLLRDAGGRTAKETEAALQPAPDQRVPRSALPRSDRGGFFTEVNARALANTDAWVKQVFPTAYWQPNATTPPGAWRIASKDLGRGLEEDIAIHTREGCQDFGTRESLSPIDLVMRHGGAPDAPAAALWLCERIGADPAALGWPGKRKAETGSQLAAETPPALEAGPSAEPAPARTKLWKDQSAWDARSIPRRPWVVPGYLMRGSVTVLSGQSAGGKSSLVVAWTISLASGQELGAFKPVKPVTVVNYNTEDDRDEQQRRYSAALIAGGKESGGIMPRIVRCGPDDVGTLFERNLDTRRVVATDAMQELECLCKKARADVLVCDPLAELHNVDENDNTAMRAVIAAFRTFAQRLGMAILILHHDRKGGSTPGDMDRVRGASAIAGAVRVMLTLTVMSADEADQLGIQTAERRRHFRLDGAKSNYAPPTEAEWWHLAAYEIGNGEQIAAVRPWEPSTTSNDLRIADSVAALTQINVGTADGYRYAVAKQAGKDWGGRVVMTMFKKTARQAASIIAAWVASGALVAGNYPSRRRGHTRRGYSVDPARLSEMRRQLESSCAR